MKKLLVILLMLALTIFAAACSNEEQPLPDDTQVVDPGVDPDEENTDGEDEQEPISELDALAGKTIAVPSGTIADVLLKARLDEVEIIYCDSAIECISAVQDGTADAAAYDEPILRSLAAMMGGVKVLDEKVSTDEYAYAVALDNSALKAEIDSFLARIKANGIYAQMIDRWFAGEDIMNAMPQIATSGENGTLVFATSAITMPFAFKDASEQIVGFDVEFATRLAADMGMSIRIIDMDSLEQMIDVLTAGNADMIGACLTISAEREQWILFSDSYYTGGIAVAVKD